MGFWGQDPTNFSPALVRILFDPGSMFTIIRNCYIQGPSKVHKLSIKTISTGASPLTPLGELTAPIDLLAGGEGASYPPKNPIPLGLRLRPFGPCTPVRPHQLHQWDTEL